ncbi:MAG TPA: outer membrane protein assembly factor BamA [Candidatus Binataceae bacterium]|nr:outer membrane protein assembly factor BamA [Candidatus Binataceae bacterium]
MSFSLHDCAARFFAALLFMLAILHASAVCALTVDDLDPAQNWKVGTISFKGNHIFSDSVLQDVMRTKPRPFYTPWKSRPEFDPGAFTNDLKRLRIFYETHGYYHLRLTYQLTTQVKKKDHLVNAELDLTEGAPVKIADIDVSIDGYHPPANAPPMSKLPIHRGEIFNQQAYAAGQQILRLFFVNAGYARTTAQRHARVDVVKNTAQISYLVHVSSKAYFGKTNLRGNKKVRAKIILRELTYKEGEEYSNEKIDDSRTHLLNLHLFSAATFSSDLDSTASDIPIDLNVREKDQHTISIGGGYSTQDDFGGQLQWNDYNFLGGGRQLSALLRYADINSRASISLRQPYFLDQRSLELGISATLQEEFEQTFTLQSEAIAPQITWHITERLTGTFGYRLMYAQLNDVSTTVSYALGGFRRKGILSGPTGSLVWNNTDDQYYPTRGAIITLLGEQGGVIWGGDYKYYRATLEDRNYTTIAKNTVLATRLKFGLAQALGPGRDYPLFLRFFPGGEGSVRGYGRWRLGPLSISNDPIGGLSLFEGSVEVRHPIYQKLAGAAFIDFGQTTLKTYTFPSPIRFGFGPAVMYQTPIGPLRLDLGFPSQAPRGDSWWQVYFSIGNFF